MVLLAEMESSTNHVLPPGLYTSPRAPQGLRKDSITPEAGEGARNRTSISRSPRVGSS